MGYYKYMKEVKLKVDGVLPGWKSGTAYAPSFTPGEQRKSYGDERVYYAHIEDAQMGNWSEIVGAFSKAKELVVKDNYVYQLSTMKEGSSPLVLRGPGKYFIERDGNHWIATRPELVQ